MANPNLSFSSRSGVRGPCLYHLPCSGSAPSLRHHRYANPKLLPFFSGGCLSSLALSNRPLSHCQAGGAPCNTSGVTSHLAPWLRPKRN
jgi:hypothetical protein